MGKLDSQLVQPHRVVRVLERGEQHVELRHLTVVRALHLADRTEV